MSSSLTNASKAATTSGGIYARLEISDLDFVIRHRGLVVPQGGWCGWYALMNERVYPDITP